MEEVLFETERVQSRGEIADLLRTVADRLDEGEPLSLSSGNDSVTVDVPPQAEFEVKVERERESGGSELSVEFELEWDENGGDDGLNVA
jgi:amphi-Trp domain-containing protein